MGQSTEELSTQIAGTRESLASDLDALQDRVSPSAIVERRKEAARGRVRSMKDKVMGSSQRVGQTTAGDRSASPGTLASVKGSVGDTTDVATDAFEGSPMVAGLIAFSAGLLIAALIPATEAEQEASRRVVDAAQPLVEEAKTVGQDVGATLRDSAADAAQQVKETAQDSAQTVRSEGQSSVENVKEEAPGQS